MLTLKTVWQSCKKKWKRERRGKNDVLTMPRWTILTFFYYSLCILLRFYMINQYKEFDICKRGGHENFNFKCLWRIKSWLCCAFVVSFPKSLQWTTFCCSRCGVLVFHHAPCVSWQPSRSTLVLSGQSIYFGTIPYRKAANGSFCSYLSTMNFFLPFFCKS